jgi:hypothetical protein
LARYSGTAVHVRWNTQFLIKFHLQLFYVGKVSFVMRRSPALTICLVAGIAGVVLAVYLGYDLYQKRNATISSAEEETRRQVASAAREIDAELQRYAGLVDALAEDLSAGRVTESDRDARLTEIMSANPELYAVGIAYAPHAHDSRRRLFAPSSVRSGKALQLLGLEERLDYTGDDVEWFWAAMKNNTSWDEPVWNESEGKAIATYSAPLYPPDGVGRELLGVVFLSLTLDQVAKRVDALDIGKTGYGVVVSQKGYFLVHPSDADIRNRVSLFELQEMQSDASTRAALEAATHGKSGVFERENRMTGQDTWFFYEPIPTPRWSMFVTLIKDEIRFDQKYLR